MKAKLLSVLALSALLFSCGGNGTSSETPTTSQPTTSESTSETTSETTSESTSESTSEEVTGETVTLTAETLLGYAGTEVAYNTEEATSTVDGVDLSYIQIGCYGNGLQMRDKDGKTSSLWNTTAFASGIKRIELTYSANQEVKHANPDAVIFSFGNDTTVSSFSTKLSTEVGQKTYTITPDAETYTFFKLEHDLGYSFYWDSIVIVY